MAENPKPPMTPPKPPDTAPKPGEGKVQPASNKKVELVVDDNTVCKVQVPHDFNLKLEWEKFKDEHKEITEKKMAFPTSFVGDLVNKHGCTQLDNKEEGCEKVHLTV